MKKQDYKSIILFVASLIVSLAILLGISSVVSFSKGERIPFGAFRPAQPTATSTGNKMPDDRSFDFGTDQDFRFIYDSTNARLEINDGTNDFLRIVDAGTTGTFSILGSLDVSGTLTATGFYDWRAASQSFHIAADKTFVVDGTASISGTTTLRDLNVENTGTGQSIFINQDGNGIALEIDSEATSQPAFKSAVDVVYTGSGATAAHFLTLGNGSATGDVLYLLNAGTGYGLAIDQNGNGGAFKIDTEATTGNAASIQAELLTTGDGLLISVDTDAMTTGKAFRIMGGSDHDTEVFSIDADGAVSISGTFEATGLVDIGGGTAEAPNPAPTVDSEGEFGTDSTEGQWVYYSAGSELALNSSGSFDFGLISSEAFDEGKEYLIGPVPFGITLTSCSGVVDYSGETAAFTIGECDVTSGAIGACTAAFASVSAGNDPTSAESITNPEIEEGDYINLEIGTVGSNIDYLWSPGCRYYQTRK